VRIIIECPERILHLEAGYIYADCPLAHTSNLLQSGGGPYIFANHRLGPPAWGLGAWVSLRFVRPGRIYTLHYGE